MKQVLRFSWAVVFLAFGAGVMPAAAGQDGLNFIPVTHASFVMQAGNTVIYVDPVGSPGLYQAYPAPDLILITHEHRDHLSAEVIREVRREQTLILCPQTVRDQLGQGRVLNNGDETVYNGMTIQAIPAYNTTPDRLGYHPRGKGNGYVITAEGKRVYVSGDTEDIPEMRELTRIDFAFVCMNLPYTMTVDQAVSAVLAFRPGTVFPYHFRGKAGVSDVARFKAEVEQAGQTHVTLLPWYP